MDDLSVSRSGNRRYVTAVMPVRLCQAQRAAVASDDRTRVRSSHPCRPPILRIVIIDDPSPQLADLAPSPALSKVAIEPPGSEPGNWAGAPSAVADGDEIVLAYRLRRPIGQGRGYAVALARSADGVWFETIGMITREQMDAESLERPALIRTAEGSWRLYLSCATAGTKHWRVELLEAAAPDAFDPRQRAVILPGDSHSAVKDPVIVNHAGTWHLWAS